MKHYSYSILRYSHNPVAGEAINIGLLLYSKEEGFAGLRLYENYGYLGKLYRDFSKDDFEMKLKSLKSQIRQLQPQLRELPLLEQLPLTSVELGKKILPDQGGSFRFGTLGRGRGEVLENELENLYLQLITNQRPESQHSERRDSHSVWQNYRRSLDKFGVTPHLEQYEIETPSVKIDFEHTYQNGHRNALEALSLDYADPNDISGQAAKWVTYSNALKKSSSFGKLYLLLGKPNPQATHYKKEHLDAYQRALHLLQDMPKEHEFIEEEHSAEFAEELADKMKREGFLVKS